MKLKFIDGGPGWLKSATRGKKKRGFVYCCDHPNRCGDHSARRLGALDRGLKSMAPCPGDSIGQVLFCRGIRQFQCSWQDGILEGGLCGGWSPQ